MEEKIIQMIEENPVALATCTKNGEPHVIAVNFVKVKDDKILITNNYMEKTIENLEENNLVSLVVWDNEMEGISIEGTAEHLDEGKEYDYIKNIEENKDEPCNGVIIVTPASIEEL